MHQRWCWYRTNLHRLLRQQWVVLYCFGTFLLFQYPSEKSKSPVPLPRPVLLCLSCPLLGCRTLDKKLGNKQLWLFQPWEFSSLREKDPFFRTNFSFAARPAKNERSRTVILKGLFANRLGWSFLSGRKIIFYFCSVQISSRKIERWKWKRIRFLF